MYNVRYSKKSIIKLQAFINSYKNSYIILIK